MNNSDTAIREINLATAQKLMSDFGRNMEGWYDNLHEDIVMEFPNGGSVGLPNRLEGKAVCSALFAITCEQVQVVFHDVIVQPMLDPNRFLVEYKGHSEPGGKSYDPIYIGVQQYKDGKLILFREYIDTKVVDETFGDLSALGGAAIAMAKVTISG